MRFWQKIFLYSLALLIVTTSTVSLLLLRANHTGNVDQARQNGLNTHDLLIGSMQTAVIHDRYQAGDEFLNEASMLVSILRLADSFGRQILLNDPQGGHDSVIYFQLFNTEELLYSNLPFEIAGVDQPELSVNAPLDRFTIIRSLPQGRWLFVSSLVELENRTYTLVSVKDVSMLYQQLDQQVRLFADLMLVLSLTAAGVLLLIVVILTRPIGVLRQYAARFSVGEYHIRLRIKGRDELSELGHDFNNMAEAVENNILSLRQMNEDRTRFIDNLTHEIKSPLTSIIGFSDLLRQAPDLGEERLKQAEYIYREGRHLENIAKLLMELTLLGRDQFERERVDLYDLLEETILLSQPILEKYQIQMELEHEHGLVEVSLELFRSLLSNLIENAGKASQSGDTVTLKGEADASGGMRISVQDNGCGIPEEELEKIRQPFYVLDKARTRSSGGAGLGLALCDEIARLHHTRLEIESQLNAGTTVSLLFPPARDNESEREDYITGEPEVINELVKDNNREDGSERREAADD